MIDQTTTPPTPSKLHGGHDGDSPWPLCIVCGEPYPCGHDMAVRAASMKGEIVPCPESCDSDAPNHWHVRIVDWGLVKPNDRPVS